MKRVEILMKGLDRSMTGIEIAPWHAPVAARRDGWNIRILDVFDADELGRRSQSDPTIRHKDSNLIEEVDYVGSATEIARLVPAELHGTFDYIVSSHNFEHLPDPIRFLQGCEQVLRPGGVLTMAVPDRRATFDQFRPLTTTGNWIAAHLTGQVRPSQRQAFEHGAYGATAIVRGKEKFALSPGHSPDIWSCGGDLLASFEAWRDRLARGDESYHDCHCTVMTPASLELMLYEVRCLNLTGLTVETVSEPRGCEFFVRIVKPAGGTPAPPDAGAVGEMRNRLLRRIQWEACHFTWLERRNYRARGLRGVAHSLRDLGRWLRGLGTA